MKIGILVSFGKGMTMIDVASDELRVVEGGVVMGEDGSTCTEGPVERMIREMLGG